MIQSKGAHLYDYEFEAAEQLDIFSFLGDGNNEIDDCSTDDTDILPDEHDYMSEWEIEDMLKKHETLVHMVINRYFAFTKSRAYSQIEHEEVVQIGMVGLYQAIKRFNPAYNYQFSTYAVRYIRGYILSAFPKYENGLNYTVRAKAYRNRVVRSGVNLDTLTSEDILNMFEEDDISISLAEEVLDAIKNRTTVALDAPVKKHGDDDSGECTAILDSVGVEEEASSIAENNEILQRAIALLDDRERTFVTLRAEGYTQEEISEMYNINQSTVSRVFRMVDKKVADLKYEYYDIAY